MTPCPSHAGQRPPLGAVEREPRGAVAARASPRASRRRGGGSRPRRRGTWPAPSAACVRLATDRRRARAAPCARRGACRSGRARRRPRPRALRAAPGRSTWRTSVLLPDPDTPATTVIRPTGTRRSTPVRLLARAPVSSMPRVAASRRTRAGANRGPRSASRGRRSGFGEHLGGRPRGDDRARRAARPRGRDRSGDRRRGSSRRRARRRGPWSRSSASARRLSSSRAVSRGCRPMVGSSST